MKCYKNGCFLELKETPALPPQVIISSDLCAFNSIFIGPAYVKIYENRLGSTRYNQVQSGISLPHAHLSTNCVSRRAEKQVLCL